LTDIYPAGEERLPGVTLDALAAAIRRSIAVPLEVVPQLDQVVPTLVRIGRAGDVVVLLGAGSIGGIADRLVAALGGRP
jgi:UDP-N-acetylmuramate--alanine ligase